MRVSITHKTLAGYVVLATLLVAVSLFALHALYRITSSADAAAVTKLEVLATVKRLQAGMAALELYERKYLETPSSSLLELFQAQKEDFDRALRHLSEVGGETSSFRQITARYDHYLELFAEQIDLLRGGERKLARQHSVTLLRQQAGQLSSALDELAIHTQSDLEERLSAIAGSGKRASVTILSLTLCGSFLGLALALLAARHLTSSLHKLKKATHLIAEGAFDYDPQIQSADEIGDLARDLTTMAQKLKGYEQLCLDASPLTRLPGNIAIERALQERIRRKEKFALCYADLDDFKAYNDSYGYGKGSEVIKVTGEIIHEAKRLYGGDDDFVGHIGGDDFVLITAPEKVSDICERIVREFDRIIPAHYAPEDRKRGFIEGVDHYGVARQFPIMTISIAVVSDVRRTIQSPTEIARVAAEIKEYVKVLPGSNYLVDRRRGSRQGGGP